MNLTVPLQGSHIAGEAKSREIIIPETLATLLAVLSQHIIIPKQLNRLISSDSQNDIVTVSKMTLVI